MANQNKRVPENVPGDFFVDSTCIDCDACRQIASSVFGEAAETLSSRPSRFPALPGGRRCRLCWPALQGPSAVSAEMT